MTRKEVLYECVYCGEQYVDKVSSGIPHDFAQILTTKIPGCGVDGEVSQVCTMCGREAFFKEIPRTSEHNLTLLEDKEYTKYFAGKRRYKCENCGAIVYEYYGEYGVYDLDAIKEAMTQYVRQYGFNIEIAESGDEITDGKFYYHDFYLCEIMGAHDYLYDKVFASVERWCQKHLENCQEYGTDPRLYTCTVYLGFYESGSMGGSSFVVYVTAS